MTNCGTCFRDGNTLLGKAALNAASGVATSSPFALPAGYIKSQRPSERTPVDSAGLPAVLRPIERLDTPVPTRPESELSLAEKGKTQETQQLMTLFFGNGVVAWRSTRHCGGHNSRSVKTSGSGTGGSTLFIGGFRADRALSREHGHNGVQLFHAQIFSIA